MRALPNSEAILLSVYFEEVSQRTAEMNEEMRGAGSSSGEAGYETVFEVGEDEGFEDEEDDE